MNVHFLSRIAAILAVSGMISCSENVRNSLFEQIPADRSGIQFANEIVEDEQLNILSFEYFYNGAGIGIGDFNNDDLPDIFFSSNMGKSRLYLNQGDFRFSDRTDSSGIQTTGKWATGVSVVDINQDGYDDIYLCFAGPNPAEKRANALYINNKDNTFTDKASEYGLADDGHSVQAVFFDYDKDSDLDMYLLTNIVDELGPNVIRPKRINGEMVNTDRLYRNNGNQTFSNISREAGILKEGYGLGVSVCDINKDGWPDIFVSNDYLSNDLLYINNQDGTFTDQAATAFRHTSYSAMGNDVADINNDGKLDIMEVDMLPPDNFRKKLMFGSTNHERYRSEIQYGYQPQFMRNTLQLNQGLDTDGAIRFSEIAMYSGVHATDWSWSPLLADFDNDGWKDLLITNGYPRDITDRDFINFRAQEMNQGGNPENKGRKMLETLKKLDGALLNNFIFKNNGDLTFSDVSNDWGLTAHAYSTGAAYADFDSDGDLDVVITNTGKPAFLYRNKSETFSKNNFLQLSFIGPIGNRDGYGVKVSVYAGGTHQYLEHYQVRGYQSSVEKIMHIGLQKSSKVDSLRIEWPDGNQQTLIGLKPNQRMVIDHSNSHPPHLRSAQPQKDELFTGYQPGGLEFVHMETPYTDFNIQPLLPHKFSMGGPGMAVGDVNGDGREDLYVGGGYNQSGEVFIQQKGGRFLSRKLDTGIKYEEDMGALFFDADNDKDVDLYVVSGGNEFADGSEYYQDRFYRNDGKGNFVRDRQALPIEFSSGSCVTAADYDADGDLDLFVGGRIRPQHYPEAGHSFILRNEGGRFADVTDQLAPGLRTIGIVNAALWSDANNDNRPDLVLAGEWMPITIMVNNGQSFINKTTEFGFAKTVGWWNSVHASDLNLDGKIDYIAGNLGLNSRYTSTEKEPLSIYVHDFSNNGNRNAVITYSKEGKQYPIHPKDDLMLQLPALKKKFLLYKDYANATIQDLFPKDQLKQADKYIVQTFSSALFLSRPEGSWELKPLPGAVQFAPVFGTLINDFDADGWEDILLIGNDYSVEVINGRYDAGQGMFLKGDGKGGFSTVESGFRVRGDGKSLVELLTVENRKIVIASQNNDQLRCYMQKTAHPSSGFMRVQHNDAYAIIQLKSGKKWKKEFYYGAGYLSGSSRNFKIPTGAKSITMVTFDGKSRIVSVD